MSNSEELHHDRSEMKQKICISLAKISESFCITSTNAVDIDHTGYV